MLGLRFLISGCLLGAAFAAEEPALMERIVVSDDGKGFAGAESGLKFIVWGVNYDHDSSGRLLEDYWEDEWETVAEDFREIKDLGANVVRIHLQLGKFMSAPDAGDAANLARLADLVELAEKTGLYLDVTGLGCYHKKDVPAWYDALPEQERWAVQARFWEEVATVCRASPAIFCYGLMNEPILDGGGKKGKGWLAGELGGKFYVQRITLDSAGRDREKIAEDWVGMLSSAIRKVDDTHLLTVGVIPWAHVFKGAKPLFHSPEAGRPLDFVSVHFYPKAGEVDEALEALKVYEVGKPLVIEEIFPLAAGIAETSDFIERSRSHCDGWISFYWGKTAAEYKTGNDIKSAVIGDWLEAFSEGSAQAGWIAK